MKVYVLDLLVRCPSSRRLIYVCCVGDLLGGVSGCFPFESQSLVAVSLVRFRTNPKSDHQGSSICHSTPRVAESCVVVSIVQDLGLG